MRPEEIIETSIKGWGTSRGIRIPKSVCENCFMDIGSEITMRAGTDEVGPYVVIRPVQSNGSKYADVPAISMDEAFGSWEGDYRPEEADWGYDEGAEEVA